MPLEKYAIENGYLPFYSAAEYLNDDKGEYLEYIKYFYVDYKGTAIYSDRKGEKLSLNCKAKIADAKILFEVYNKFFIEDSSDEDEFEAEYIFLEGKVHTKPEDYKVNNFIATLSIFNVFVNIAELNILANDYELETDVTQPAIFAILHTPSGLP